MQDYYKSLHEKCCIPVAKSINKWIRLGAQDIAKAIIFAQPKMDLLVTMGAITSFLITICWNMLCKENSYLDNSLTGTVPLIALIVSLIATSTLLNAHFCKPLVMDIVTNYNEVYKRIFTNIYQDNNKTMPDRAYEIADEDTIHDNYDILTYISDVANKTTTQYNMRIILLWLLFVLFLILLHILNSSRVSLLLLYFYFVYTFYTINVLYVFHMCKKQLKPLDLFLSRETKRRMGYNSINNSAYINAKL